MKPSIYIETSIISYLAARPSRDVISAAHQTLTQRWWNESRSEFDLFTSQAVVDEIRGGDADASARREQYVADMPLLVAGDAGMRLASTLIQILALPSKAAVDAVHIAIATVNGVQYLLTWNCTHIANATLRPRIESVCRASGFIPPIICTPEELLNVRGEQPT